MKYSFDKELILEKAKELGFKAKFDSDTPGLLIKDTKERITFSEALQRAEGFAEDQDFIQKFKEVSRVEEYLYDGFMKIEKVSGPQEGKVYERLVLGDAVAAMVFDRDGKFAAVKQMRPALQKETLEIVAGVLDKDHLTPEETVLEEIQEELGFSEEEMSKLTLQEFTEPYYPMIGVTDSKISIYVFFYDGIGESRILELPGEDVSSSVWLHYSDIMKKSSDMKTVLACSLFGKEYFKQTRIRSSY